MGEAGGIGSIEIFRFVNLSSFRSVLWFLVAAVSPQLKLKLRPLRRKIGEFVRIETLLDLPH